MALSDFQVNIPSGLMDDEYIPPDEIAAWSEEARKEDLGTWYENMLSEVFLKLLQANPGNVDALNAEYEKEVTAAKAFVKFGMPLTSLKHYQEVEGMRKSGTFGKAMQDEYKSFKERESVFRKEQQAARQNRIAQLQMGVATPAGRRQLEQAIRTGDITEDEAIANNPFYHEYVAQLRADAEKQAETDRKREIAAAPGQARATENQLNSVWAANQQYQKDAANAMTPVDRGMLANRKFVDGANILSPDSMSREEATRVFGQQPVTTGKSDAANQLEKWILIARKEGIDTTQQEETYRQLGNRGTAGDQTMAYAVQQLGEAIQQKKQGKRVFDSQILANQFPDLFQQFQAESQKTGANDLMVNWLENNPAAKKMVTDRDAQQLNDYGSLFAAYKDNLSNLKSFDEYKPFDQWAIEKPETKLAYDEIQKRKMLRSANPRVGRPIFQR